MRLYNTIKFPCWLGKACAWNLQNNLILIYFSEWYISQRFWSVFQWRAQLYLHQTIQFLQNIVLWKIVIIVKKFWLMVIRMKFTWMFVELCSLGKIAASSLLCKVVVFFFESMTIENIVCYNCSLKTPVNALVNPTLLKIINSTEIIYQTSFHIETSFQGHDNSWIVIFSVIVTSFLA